MDIMEAGEVLDGVMFSDGGLIVPFRGVNARLQVKLSGEEHLDWLYYIRDALETLGVRVSPGYPKLVAHRAGRQLCVMLSTLCDPLLTEQHHRWYCQGRKEVPRDFYFTPIILANAHMGDGSTRVSRTSISVQLCVEAFSLSSIEQIEQELLELGIPDLGRTLQYRRLKNGGSGVRVNIGQDSVDYFMDMVEPYILPSYRYKIKRKQW